jgi:hypothetical protein
MAYETPTSPVLTSHPSFTLEMVPLVSPDANADGAGPHFEGNTWAQRNPEKVILPARSRAKTNDAQKSGLKIAAERNRLARIDLAQDITTLVATRKRQIEDLGVKHCVTAAHIQKLTDNASHYKKTRAPNLSNALIHKKAKELNEGV